jgi:hypothetical protein
MDTQQTAAPTAHFWALLVGINSYQSTGIGALRGCVNDVQAMKVFLINQLNVPEEHIRLITDQDATRAGILAAFREFLIENPDIKLNDQILFHYSGHGTRMRAPQGWGTGGYVEALVPHDSRTAGEFDIPDRTLGALLDQLAAAKGNQITVILDACHSGSGTRDIETDGAARARSLPADNRIPPVDLDAGILNVASARSAGPSGWPTHGMPYVLLAGCRDHELAREYWAKTMGDQQEGVWHGALTYFTLQTLRDLGQASASLRYVDLHEQVAAQVNLHYPQQMPQCEGEGRTRIVFGGQTIESDPFITVQRVEGRNVTLGAGLVHGLQAGTRLALYPPELRTRADLPPAPLCSVEVTSVSVVTAMARILDAESVVVPMFARGVIAEHVYGGLRQSVALAAHSDPESQAAIDRLRAAISPKDGGRKPSPYVEIQDHPNGFNLRVVAEAGALRIYGADNQLLVMPELITGEGREVAAVVHALESIARYRSLQALANLSSGSALTGRIKLQVRRYEPGAPAGAEDGLIGKPGQDLTLFYEPDRPERNLYVVEVINESALPIYPHLFVLNPDFSIHRLYPNQGQQSLVPGGGGMLSIGLPASADDPMRIFLPDMPRWDSCRDYLKVIVTTSASDLELLAQEALVVPSPNRDANRGARGSALDTLLDAVLSGSGTRFGGSAGLARGEDWATAELTVTVIRAARTADLTTGVTQVPLGDQLTLIKPTGFVGNVTVTTLGETTRGEAEPPPPPGLERFPDHFQPAAYPGTRGIAAPGFVVDFAIDEASRSMVGPNSPLRLELPPNADQGVVDLMPVAFDGEDYMFVGYRADDAGAVEVVGLPLVAGAPTTRGLARTIRLFIYKKIGRHTADIGLRAAELVDDQVVYRPVERNRFSPGQHVALFMHGFTSDTEWMIRNVAPFLRQEVLAYDHLLTFDYESFGTSVEDNGEQLALALRQQCGFGPEDQVTLHVYAHSMGSVAARCMIELSGGHDYVDRLVMAGPPNRGTTLATSSRGLIYIATELLNSATAIPPLGGANWLLKQLYQQSQGLADMAVDSDLLRRINSLEQPSNILYLVLAGENLLDEAERNRLNRLTHKILDTSLDTLFGEQNDLVIGKSSLTTVRGGSYPLLRIEPLPCNHFDYFQVPAGREAIKRWFTETS